MITCGVVAIVLTLAVINYKLRTAERWTIDNTHKLKAYTDLLNVIIELNLAGGDPYKTDIAKKTLALTLNRLNLIGCTGVLKSTNDLLDFFNEHKDKEYDTLRLHNILNTLVIEARHDLNPSHARKIEDAQGRYRFFVPPKNQ
ncbi:MAG: hypothetical protein WCF90_02800 [Methanomicrobiales archaeon]